MAALAIFIGAGALWFAKKQALGALPPTQATGVAPSAPSANCVISVPASTAGSSNTANEDFATVGVNAPSCAPGTGAASQTPTKTTYPPSPNNFAVLQAHPVVKTYPWIPNSPRRVLIQPNERGRTWSGRPMTPSITYLNPPGGLVVNGVVVGGSGGGGAGGGHAGGFGSFNPGGGKGYGGGFTG